MTILEKGNFRLQSITKMSVLAEKAFPEELETKEGLAIERKNPDNTYCVICFVKWNEHEHCPITESVDKRLLNIDKKEWGLLCPLLNIANDIVEVLNMKED